MTNQTTSSQFLFLFRHPVGAPDPSPEEMQKSFEKWMSWINGLKSTGACLASGRLTDEAHVLRGKRAPKRTDGPFVEGKEVIGGYLVVTARDLAAAGEIAEQCPGLEGIYSVEVRPIQSR
jgi:hypothetical protein